MRSFLNRHWFLGSLAVVLVVSIGLGRLLSEGVSQFYLSHVRPEWTTALVLFLMAFTLDSGQRGIALRQPLPALWAATVNMIVLPLLAWPSAWLLGGDYQAGLVVTALAPCTLATASVLTRKARGNDAVALLVTLVSNAACVVTTPFWLRLQLHQQAELNVDGIIRQLIVSVILPLLAGQLAQVIPIGHRLALRHRDRLGAVAQILVLLLVSVAAIQVGRTLRQGASDVRLAEFLVMAGVTILLHTAGLAAGWYGCWPGIGRQERIAVAISGSQKTLPIGMMVLALLGPSVPPMAVFPLLIYHAGQLIIDSLLAERWARQDSAI